MRSTLAALMAVAALASPMASASNVDPIFYQSQGKVLLPHLKVGSAVYGVLLRQIPGQLAFTVDTKTLTPLLPLTFTPALAADLVGSFSPEDEPTSTLTLNADGSYTVVVGATDDPSCPKAGGSESGTYQYEPSTGVFTAMATVDNNGECGLSHPDGIVRVKKVGTTIYYMSKDNGVAFEMKLNRK